MTYDVAVLGAGIAGTAAALAATRAGARVCVITGPPGATALFSGAWRGPCPPELANLLSDSGYKLHECDAALPHPGGFLLRPTFSSAAHRKAEPRANAVVCGIAGLPSFEVSVLAARWGAAAQLELKATTITVAATPRAGWAPASLATIVEREPEEFASAVLAAAKQFQPEHIILPAILGLDDHQGVHTRVQQAVGCELGEALATPPSLPGWRLQAALGRALTKANVTVLEGRARLKTRANGAVSELSVATETITARAFVLATGKFMAGGIVADATLHEPAFDTPIWIDHIGEQFTAPEPLMLTDPEREEDQPLLRAGVHTDAERRPVNQDGDVVYTNVLVAGSVRADWDVNSRGIGDCAQDGWSAGEVAVKS